MLDMSPDEQPLARSRTILLVHGSKDSRWGDTFRRLATEVRGQVGGDTVRLAYLEFEPPTLEETANEAARDGIPRLRILPLFMAAGAHLEKDILLQVQSVQRKFPQLEVVLLPPIGKHPRLLALLKELVLESIPS